MRSKLIVNVGDEFGRWVVQDKSERSGHCLCRCQCGNLRDISKGNLISGKTKSCGCLKREMWTSEGNPNYKHGYAHKTSMRSEYHTWYAMKKRCQNPSDTCYHLYGGRGISVCDRWLDKKQGFENFLADMGDKPGPKFSIDRVNSDGNYEPGNCRWATSSEQARNRRGLRPITFNGVTKLMSDWAEDIGITPGGLFARLAKRNVSLTEALRPRTK